MSEDQIPARISRVINGVHAEDLFDQMEVGDEFTDEDRFASYTGRNPAGTNFMSPGNSVVMELNEGDGLEHARPIRDVSHQEGEDEYLMNRNARYRVIGKI